MCTVYLMDGVCLNFSFYHKYMWPHTYYQYDIVNQFLYHTVYCNLTTAVGV